MSEHLLLADIGNTCIKIVFARPDALEAAYSLPTRASHTADSLGLSLLQLLSLRRLKSEDITACLVCSVVPDVSTIKAVSSTGAPAMALSRACSASRSHAVSLGEISTAGMRA